MTNPLDSLLESLASLAAKQPAAIRTHRLFTKAAQQINPTSTMALPTIEESVVSPIFLVMSIMVEEARKEERDACCNLAAKYIMEAPSSDPITDYVKQEREKSND